MKCYIISLPNAKERLARTQHEIVSCCPDYDFSIPDICVGALLSDTEFNELHDDSRILKRAGRVFTRGEIGCVLSHQSAMKDFLASSEEAAFFVEDDVVLSPVMNDVLRDMDHWFVNNGELPHCIICTQASCFRAWTRGLRVSSFRLIKPISVFGTVAYLLNRKGAELILRTNSLPIRVTADDWDYFCEQGLAVHCIHPCVAGSYDYGRRESSLAKERKESIMPSKCNVNLASKIANAVKTRVTTLWYFISGARRVQRDNCHVYRLTERTDLWVKK